MASSCLYMFLVFLAFTVPADSNYGAGPFPSKALSRRLLWSPETVPPPPPLSVPMQVISVSPPPPLMVPPLTIAPPTQGTYMTFSDGGSEGSSGSGLSLEQWILIIVCSIVALCSLIFCIYLRCDKGEQPAPLPAAGPLPRSNVSSNAPPLPQSQTYNTSNYIPRDLGYP